MSIFDDISGAWSGIKILFGGGDMMDFKQVLQVILPPLLAFLVKMFGDKIGMTPELQNGFVAALLYIAGHYLGTAVTTMKFKRFGVTLKQTINKE